MGKNFFVSRLLSNLFYHHPPGKEFEVLSFFIWLILFILLFIFKNLCPAASQVSYFKHNLYFSIFDYEMTTSNYSILFVQKQMNPFITLLALVQIASERLHTTYRNYYICSAEFSVYVESTFMLLPFKRSL